MATWGALQGLKGLILAFARLYQISRGAGTLYLQRILGTLGKGCNIEAPTFRQLSSFAARRCGHLTRCSPKLILFHVFLGG